MEIRLLVENREREKGKKIMWRNIKKTTKTHVRQVMSHANVQTYYIP